MSGEANWLGIAELTAGEIGIVVGVIGIVLAIYFYAKSKRKVQISYSVNRTQLLGGNRNVLPDEVSIFYQSDKINDLVKFNTIFWNSGNASIRKSDIAEPLLLCLPKESRPLKVSALKYSRPQNRVILYLVKNELHKMRVDFEYLEPRQGFNLEVLLTGEVKGDPWPTGAIIGMPEGFRKFNEQVVSLMAQVLFTFMMAITVITVIVLRQLTGTMLILRHISALF
jgi:hypothetical protein